MGAGCQLVGEYINRPGTREDAPETCAETIHLTAGGEAGRHLSAIVTPLIVHDLPVTVWWPGEPPFTSRPARDLLAGADRLIVDGSSWSGDGLGRLREMAHLVETTDLAVSDFALVRQSRWREAIASIFDDQDFLPFLRSLRRIAVTYSTHDETGAPGSTNLVKPVTVGQSGTGTLSAFGEDVSGELYVTGLDGSISKLLIAPS